MDPSARPVAEPRCYFALLDERLHFRYLDPVFRACLGEQAPLFLHTTLYRWMHPEELPAAQADAEAFLRNRTLFGTVTRCRFYRPSAIREALGAPPASGDASAMEDMTSLDRTWTQIKIVASWIGEGTVLAFFHAVVDRDPVVDNDEQSLSPWTNWCGPPEWDPTEYFLSAEERNAMSRAMTDMDYEAQQQQQQHHQQSHPYESPHASAQRDDHPPRYVFQILTSNDARLVLSQPAPRYLTPSGPSSAMDYDALEYARLAKDVWEKPRERNTEAKSNCTQRFRSKHPIMKDGVLTTIESVVIRYNSVCFACFQTRGIFSNPKGGAEVTRSTVSPSPAMPSQFDDHLRRSTSAVSLPNPPPPATLLGKRRRSRSDAPSGSAQGQGPPHPRPMPLTLNSNISSSAYAASAALHSPWTLEHDADGLSPTVATGAALLGSLTHARTHQRGQQYPPASYPYQQQQQQQQQHAPSTAAQDYAANYPVRDDSYPTPSAAAVSAPPQHSLSQTHYSALSLPQDRSGSYAHSSYYPNPPYTGSASYPAYYSGPSTSAAPLPGPSHHPPHPPQPPRSAPPPEAPLQRTSSHLSGGDFGHDMRRSHSAGAFRSESPNPQSHHHQHPHTQQQQPLDHREDQFYEDSSDPGNSTAAAARRQRRQAREAEAGRTCASCGTSNSPEWRKGPTGIKSLCNACGLRYARSVARDARKEAEAQAAAEGKPPPQFPNKKKKPSCGLSNPSPDPARQRSPSASQQQQQQGPARALSARRSSSDDVKRSSSPNDRPWRAPPPAALSLPPLNHRLEQQQHEQHNPSQWQPTH